VPDWFWRLFREEVRRVKPDAYVIAELWGNAAPDLTPLRFDATMNYLYFRDPVLAFIGRGKIDAPTFDRQLAGGRYGYPLPAALGAMNLIGSHDTERFVTLAGGDQRRLLLALLFGATYAGVPHIYYGDEIGMMGGADPDCRRPFPWGELDEPARSALRDRVKEYLALRAEHPAFRRGDFLTLFAEDQLFAFARSNEEDRLVVLLNAGHTPVEVALLREALPFEVGVARDLLADEEIHFEGDELRLRLEPFAGSVLGFPGP
jgi:glycosidase